MAPPLTTFYLTDEGRFDLKFLGQITGALPGPSPKENSAHLGFRQLGGMICFTCTKKPRCQRALRILSRSAILKVTKDGVGLNRVTMIDVRAFGPSANEGFTDQSMHIAHNSLVAAPQLNHWVTVSSDGDFLFFSSGTPNSAASGNFVRSEMSRDRFPYFHGFHYTGQT